MPVLDVVHLTAPPQCHIKGSYSSAPATGTPKVSTVPVLTTIEEVGDDSTLEEVAATLFECTVSLDDFEEVDDNATTPRVSATTCAPPHNSPIPSIVIKTCPDAPRPISVHASKLPLFDVYEYGVDYLQIPVPGEERTQSRTILGTVNRSTHGGRFTLGPAPPRRRSAKVDRPPQYDENAPTPGWF